MVLAIFVKVNYIEDYIRVTKITLFIIVAKNSHRIDARFRDHLQVSGLMFHV